jgi:hypothetical protein
VGGWNDDLKIGWRAQKESYGIAFRDAELSSGMDVGKELKGRLRIRKRLVSEWQSDWRQERAGMPTRDSGLEENEDTSARTAVRLVLAGRLVSTVHLGSPGGC